MKFVGSTVLWAAVMAAMSVATAQSSIFKGMAQPHQAVSAINHLDHHPNCWMTTATYRNRTVPVRACLDPSKS
jgi:hypothetical protein